MRGSIARLIVVMFVLCGVVVIAAPRAAVAQAPVECQQGTPPEWNFLPDASSNTMGDQILCNYTVNAAGTGASGTLIGGTAITIEYFCSAAEGAERFKSVTASSRKTETRRASDFLVIEEGPAAKNPDNPQKNGINSQLFDGDYNLMEKEWRLFNPQVFATIVVITNRGQVDEDKRFGVDDVEPIARGLANRNSAGAGCPIAATAGGGDNGAIVVIGGVAAVAAAAALIVKKRKEAAQLPDASIAKSGPKVDQIDVAVLQIDSKDFDLSDGTPAKVTLTGWNIGSDAVPKHVPMTIWITVPPGCGVRVTPDQADGQLIATISLDPQASSDNEQVALIANGVWKGKQITETITVKLAGELELRLY